MSLSILTKIGPLSVRKTQNSALAQTINSMEYPFLQKGILFEMFIFTITLV